MPTFDSGIFNFLKFNALKLNTGILFLVLGVIFCGFRPTLSAQNYFQQEANYTIQAVLYPERNALAADIEIEYFNNSPDTLRVIYMHLWPNAYKNRKTALAEQLRGNKKATLEYAGKNARGYIDSLSFKIDGRAVSWELDPKHIDIALVKLNEPLLPGKKIIITTPFYVKIPDARISRLGYYNESFAITQWYPKPAVYDQSGWHPMPYLDQGEFYSEFGKFDVSISVPADYVVAATGELQTASEKEFLGKRVEATEKFLADAGANPVSKVKSSEYKILRFTQNNVHDFAWFASREFLVQKSQVTLPNGGNTVETFAFFTSQNSKIWNKTGVEAVNKSVEFYSKKVGNYPYRVCTAVDGIISAGGGMEYPTITIIGRMGSKSSLEEVIAHEVGHNWFYGMLANNEREHPWMDEGFNSFYDNWYSREVMRDSGGMLPNMPIFGLKKVTNADNVYLPYLFQKRRGLFQPISDPSQKQKATNYGIGVYTMTAFNLKYLREYLGHETFDAIMHQYFKEYCFKHPQPSDLQNIFEKQSGKELGWFFHDLIENNQKLDYKILKAERKNNQEPIKITVKNAGKTEAPFQIKAGNNPPQWIEGFSGKKKIELPMANNETVRIDPGELMPEDNRKNNAYRSGKISPKAPKLQINFLTAVENPNRTQLFVSPVIFGNYHNGVIAGGALHNVGIIRKKVEFLVMPTFAFGNKMFTGKGFINYYHNPTGGKISEIALGLDVSRFSNNFGYTGLDEKYFQNFTRIVPFVKLSFRNASPRSPVDKFLKFRSIIVNQDLTSPKNSPVSNIYGISLYAVNEFSFQFENYRMMHPYSFNTTLEIITNKDPDINGQNIVYKPVTNLKLSATYKQQISYFRPNQGLDIRVFGGVFLTQNETDLDYRFRMSGYSPFADYRLDYPYFGRNVFKDFYFQQFIEAEGGVKSMSISMDSWSWMTAINLKASIAPKVPVKLFADFGLSEIQVTNINTGQKTKSIANLFSAGIMISLWRNAFELYFPLAHSGTFYSSEKEFLRDVRFVFDLTKVNYRNISRKIKLF